MHVLLLLHLIPGILGLVCSWNWYHTLFVQLVFSVVVYLTVHLLELKSMTSFRSNINFKQNTRRCALITGGSSGIGLEISKLFLRDGFHVIVASNDSKQTLLEAEKQFKLMSNSASYEIAYTDLTIDEARKKLFTDIERKKLIVTHLVNNAGMGVLGHFHEMEWNNFHKTIELNVVALSHVTHLFLNHVKQQRKNNIKDTFRILHTSSMGGLDPVPNFLVYGATKSFIKMFSTGLAYEVSKLGVTVTTLLPGSTRTPLLEKSNYKKASWFQVLNTLSPDFVGKCAYYHLMQGNEYAVPGILNKIIRVGMALTPEPIVCKLFEIAMRFEK